MKRLLKISVICLLLAVLVSCNSQGPNVEEKLPEGNKGYISINVPEPPLKNSSNRGITNSYAKDNYDDYALSIVSEGGLNRIWYSEREEGFNRIPLDAGTYSIYLLATKNMQVVATAASVDVVIEEFKITTVDMVLKALNITYSNQSPLYVNSTVTFDIDLSCLMDFMGSTSLQVEPYLRDSSGNSLSMYSWKYLFASGCPGSINYYESADVMYLRADSSRDGQIFAVYTDANDMFNTSTYYRLDMSLLVDEEHPEDAFVQIDTPTTAQISLLMPDTEGQYYLDFCYELCPANSGGVYIWTRSNILGVPRAYYMEENGDTLNSIYRIPIEVTTPPSGLQINVSWEED